MGLKLDVRPGDSVHIGDGVVVTMEKKSGSVARLSFKAPDDIPIRLTHGENGRVAGIAAEIGLGQGRRKRT